MHTLSCAQVVDNRIVGQFDMTVASEESGMKGITDSKRRSPHRSPRPHRAKGSPKPVRWSFNNLVFSRLSTEVWSRKPLTVAVSVYKHYFHTNMHVCENVHRESKMVASTVWSQGLEATTGQGRPTRYTLRAKSGLHTEGGGVHWDFPASSATLHPGGTSASLPLPSSGC